MHCRTILLGVISLMLCFDHVAAGRTFLSPGCADAGGLDNCWAKAVTAGQTCFKNNCKNGQCNDENNCTSTDASCVSSCVCTAYESWLNCIYTHCWNRVYTCEYQKVLVAAFANCPASGINVTIPFFPAPTDGPNRCSCDVATLYYKYRQARAEIPKCEKNNGNTTNAQNICTCCGASEVVSSFYNLCPNTSPASLSFFPNTGHPLAVLKSQTCQQALTGSVNCSTYGFARPGPAGSMFYNASDLPKNGTQNMSDSTGTISKPLAGATLVWGLVRADDATAIAASASVTGASTAPASAATSTVGSAAAAATTTSSAGSLTISVGVVTVLAVFGAMLML